MTEVRAELLPSLAAAMPLAISMDLDQKQLTDGQEEHHTEEMYIEATFMGLDHPPVIPVATSLCDDLAGRIEEWERRQEKRTNARRAKITAFRSAVGLLIVDLLAVLEKRPQRWLYRPMGKKEFSGKEVSYLTF